MVILRSTLLILPILDNIHDEFYKMTIRYNRENTIAQNWGQKYLQENKNYQIIFDGKDNKFYRKNTHA